MVSHGARAITLGLEFPRREPANGTVKHRGVLVNGISAVFPALNEEENAERLVQAALAVLPRISAEHEIIIVNDGSTDRTGELLDQLSREYTCVHTIHHSRNLGYGVALRSGIQSARHALIFFSDADLQFDLAEIPKLLEWIDRYDVVAGYRCPRRDPLHRRMNAWCWGQLVHLLLGLKVRDIDCAFKIFHRRVFDAITISTEGAMVNTDILVQVRQHGFSIKQIPVTHYPRQFGQQSGNSPRVVLKAFRELFRYYRALKNGGPRNGRGR